MLFYQISFRLEGTKRAARRYRIPNEDRQQRLNISRRALIRKGGRTSTRFGQTSR
jgi:hypothetical protein